LVNWGGIMGTFVASSRIWLRMSHGLKEIKSVSSSDRLNLQPIELQMGIASLIQGNWIANEDFRFFTLAAASVHFKSARCPQ